MSILSKIKSLLFGKPEAKKSAPPAKKSVKKGAEKRNTAKKRPAGKKSAPVSKAPVAEKKSNRNNGRKDKKERKPRSTESADSFELFPMPDVAHPEALEEVPPEEGKMRFGDLALHPEVLFGVQAAGFKYCSPIQALALPELLKGREIYIVCGNRGTIGEYDF